MEVSRVIMEVGSDGVALITFSNPPVNALALTIFAGLEEKINEALCRNDVRAIVLTGNKGFFCGGFDINVFEKIHRTGDISILPIKSIDFAINLIEDAKKPFVAAIEGLSLGGGLELAMAFHARISAPKAQLGLPELSLGVIPGMGGDARTDQTPLPLDESTTISVVASLRKLHAGVLTYYTSEYLKVALLSRKEKNNLDPNHLIESGLCGAIAGAISASLTTPLDVVKTRPMTQIHTEGVNNGVAVAYSEVRAVVKH